MRDCNGHIAVKGLSGSLYIATFGTLLTTLLIAPHCHIVIFQKATLRTDLVIPGNLLSVPIFSLSPGTFQPMLRMHFTIRTSPLSTRIMYHPCRHRIHSNLICVFA